MVSPVISRGQPLISKADGIANHTYVQFEMQRNSYYVD
jgi:hypothetical protein